LQKHKDVSPGEAAEKKKCERNAVPPKQTKGKRNRGCSTCRPRNQHFRIARKTGSQGGGRPEGKVTNRSQPVPRKRKKIEESEEGRGACQEGQSTSIQASCRVERDCRRGWKKHLEIHGNGRRERSTVGPREIERKNSGL